MLHTDKASRQGLFFGRWRFPFYYGWVIVAVVFIAEFTAAGMGGVTLSLFFKPMSESKGWTLTMLTGAVTAQAIAGMLVSPFVGPALDRFGARPVMVFGAIVAGVGLFVLMSVQEIWQFWIVYALVGALGFGEMGSVTGPVVVTKWFVRKRGRAMGIATLGIVLGGMIMAPVIGFLIDQWGWRVTWGIMGVALLVIMVPLLLIFTRRQPEDMGLLPDGATAESEMAGAQTKPGKEKTQPVVEESWTLKEALKTKTLWVLIVAMNMVSLSTSAISIHQTPYFTTQVGTSIQAAGLILSGRLLAAALGRIPMGFVIERVPVRYCLAMVCFARGLTPILLVFIPYPFNIPPLLIFGGLLGANMGLVQPMTFSNYFGRASSGSIQGMLRPFLGVSSLAGPLIIAVIFDATGTFNQAFLITGIIGLLAGVAALFATPPVRKAAPQAQGT